VGEGRGKKGGKERPSEREKERKREKGREGERDLWTCKARILNPEANLHVKES